MNTIRYILWFYLITAGLFVLWFYISYRLELGYIKHCENCPGRNEPEHRQREEQARYRIADFRLLLNNTGMSMAMLQVLFGLMWPALLVWMIDYYSKGRKDHG